MHWEVVQSYLGAAEADEGVLRCRFLLSKCNKCLWSPFTCALEKCAAWLACGAGRAARLSPLKLQAGCEQSSRGLGDCPGCFIGPLALVSSKLYTKGFSGFVGSAPDVK